MTVMINNSAPTLSRVELRKFGFILATGIILIFGLLIPWLRDSSFQQLLSWPLPWPWNLSFVLLMISLFVPMALAPIYKVWMLIGHALGYINTRLILGLIYMAMFTPVAFLLKLLGKDPMHRALDPAQHSYRVNSNQPKPENLNRPY